MPGYEMEEHNRSALRKHVNNLKRSKGPEVALGEACAFGFIDVVEELLKAGANVNLHGKGGATPLMRAAVGAHSEIVELLLKSGADVNSRDDRGRTPLILLMCTFNKEADVLRGAGSLVTAGADRTLVDSKGRTAVECLGVGQEYSDEVRQIISPE